MVVMVTSNVKVLNPLSCSPHNGLDGQFYVLGILYN